MSGSGESSLCNPPLASRINCPYHVPMEAVLLIGVQATGKSSFYRRRLFRSHVRISRDLLGTQRREERLLAACLDTGQPFAIDNTNASREERRRFIQPAREHEFTVTGYYFRSKIEEALARNAARPMPERVPKKGVLDAYGRLELPTCEEGFDQLYYVTPPAGTPSPTAASADQPSAFQFTVSEWRDDLR